MNVREARKLLGFTVEEELDVLAINARFRARALANHPDQGGNGANVTQLQEAKRVLLKDTAKCAKCQGRGAVGGFVCGVCKGRGK